MPVPRDPQLPQINAGQLLYGSIPIELLPDGTATLQVPVWDNAAQQWRLLALTPRAGIDIELDANTDTLSIVNMDYRVSANFTADGYLLRIIAGSFTANAIHLKAGTGSLTGDAVLV
jgi:hypothetical protein